jgi:hypothetical protein
MFSKERIKTVEFSSIHRSSLANFCAECATHNYSNNKDLDAIRLDWCLSEGGQFFLTYYDQKIISISGCHPLPQAGNDCYRVLFRGATLPEYQNLFNIMSKTHMSSIPFFDHLPLQLQWAISKGYKSAVVTTNWSNPDGIESMSRSHKVFHLLEKQGIVTCLHRKINIFNTDQSVWKINCNNYFKARTEYGERNGLC